MRGADPAKYGTLLKEIVTQYSLIGEKGKPNDQYPKSLAHVTDALSNYSFDSKYYKKKHKRRQDKTKRCKQNEDDNEKRTLHRKTSSSVTAVVIRPIHQPSAQRRTQDQRKSG